MLFFVIKEPVVRKDPSQVGQFQIEIFPFGKTGVNCHSKAFELLQTPTLRVSWASTRVRPLAAAPPQRVKPAG